MAIFTANVTSALTAASMEVKQNSLEGYKVFQVNYLLALNKKRIHKT